jgi:hypothetical protein
MGRENDHEQGVFVHVDHQRGEVLPLLVHAGEVRLVHEAGHELHGIVSVRAERGEGRGIERVLIAGLVNEVAGFFDEQREVRFALLE